MRQGVRFGIISPVDDVDGGGVVPIDIVQLKDQFLWPADVGGSSECGSPHLRVGPNKLGVGRAADAPILGFHRDGDIELSERVESMVDLKSRVIILRIEHFGQTPIPPINGHHAVAVE